MNLADKYFKLFPLGMNLRNILIKKMNVPRSLDLAKNKSGFKRILEQSGFAVPKTFFEIKAFSDLESIKCFPDEFVIKPNSGLGGKGVMLLRRSDGGFADPSGEKFSERQIRRHIRKILDGEFSGVIRKDSALVEERVYPSPAFLFRHAAGLPDIRVFCVKFEPVMAMFRFATNESKGRSNLSTGAVGMAIDISSGEVTHVHSKKRQCDYSFEYFGITRPFFIPKWEEMKATARKASTLSGLGISGVDIVLDRENNVRVLEINGRPGIEIQSVNQASLRSSFGI